MNELPQPVSREQVSPRISREMFDQMMRQKFSYLLIEYGTPQAAIENMLSIPENQQVMHATGQAESIRADLLACTTISEREAFAEAVFQAMQPVIERLYADANSSSPAEGKRVYVNEILSYDIQGDSLRLHIFTGGTGNLNRYTEGLSKVAEALVDLPEITTVDAISWIVAKHPMILERKLGFTVQREADGEPTRIVKEGEEIGYAYMMREDFLTKYLPKK